MILLLLEIIFLFIDKMIKRLSDEFSLHDLGDLNYFLGVKVKRHKQGLQLSQQK